MAKNKRAAKVQQDDGQQFMQRLQANLKYFQRHHPAVYKLLSSVNLQNVELVFTPGRDDVDMVAYGKSCYRGLAHEFSTEEAASVLKENPEDKPIRTFSPPGADSYRKKFFGNKLLQEVILASPLRKRPFTGYIRGNFFPSLVFLGVGLGYHIEALSSSTPIINGIIIERDPEKFAVSLYTVDWASICSRFERKGRSLTFAIGKATTSQEVRALVSRYMTRDVPFYPFFSTYYNHLADVEIAQGVLDTAKDLSVVSTNWVDYDNEMVRLVNSAHNLRRGIRYVARAPDVKIDKPVVVVGSGPSLDQRIEDLKKVRDQVVIISAGTGLRPLLAAGIVPDFQMDLDPGYVVYRFHSESDRHMLKSITLLAVNEVNPNVAGLFGDVIYYFKTDNAFPQLLGLEKSTFRGCNPTVTNAALAFSHAMGAGRIYLFGTDYGFESVERDHADHSVYGAKSDTEVSRTLRANRAANPKKRKTFEVPSVRGATVLTRSDYYAAKRSVEELIYRLKQEGRLFDVYNCAEGAVIEGTTWLETSVFHEHFSSQKGSGEKPGLSLEVVKLTLESLPANALDNSLAGVHKELRRQCSYYERLIKSARLRGRRDLCTTVNELRQSTVEIKPLAGQPVSREQIYVHQLLMGSIKHFLYTGLCHGMASTDAELEPFLKTWREKFVQFLAEVPPHFERVIFSGLSVEEDLWTKRTLHNPDPEFEGEMPLESLQAQADL